MRAGAWFLVALLAPVAGADAAHQAPCRATCRRLEVACVRGFRDVLRAARHVCPGPHGGRCRVAATRAFAAGRHACRRAERVECVLCCRLGRSGCSVSVCGNAIRTGTEECDDGNRVDDDGCDARCRLPATSPSPTTTTTLPPRVTYPSAFTTFESGLVRPLALSADGARLFAVNTPDDRLEILDVGPDGLTRAGSVPVGLEPVAVAVRPDGTAWVVNHLSDSVSVVDTTSSPPRVVRTLLVGDEPRDVVFAGPGGSRAFVTTAHRGQNSPVDLALATSGIGRADVWVFDADRPGDSLGGTPLEILTLFGDTPRALATSPDGQTVYVAVFQSGNRTGTVPAAAVCDGGASAPPCAVEGLVMPGGLPAPNVSADGAPQPEVGLIARYDPATGRWDDGIGRDWSPAMRFALPDLDVFAIDAGADPPVERRAFAGVGTVLYAMATNPLTGRLYIANTEANNEVRFSGFGLFGGPTVRGHLHETRVTVVDPADGSVQPHRLNPHIDYAVVPSPPGMKEASLALPVALAVTADGQTLYVTGFGSSAIGVVGTAALEQDQRVPDAADQIAVTGGGPGGIVLDEPRGRLYVLTRFDDAVAVVDTATRREVGRVALYDPEPAEVVAGRALLYDARAGSSNGEAACASCHVFADQDGLAWDLGDPDGSVVNNPLRLRNAGTRTDKDFHPLKGPMTTQTLRGIATHGSMHWRGDRTAGDEPGGDPDDELGAFLQFNAAFDGLMGRGGPVSDAEMAALAGFVLQIMPPPNPIRALDGALTPEQQDGERFFFGDGGCSECHVVDPARGYFGTDGAAAIAADRPQFLKIPHLRNLYQKIGRDFGTFAQPPNAGDVEFMGDQIRGFGFTHDGAAGALRSEPIAFLMAFVSNLAPIVGQQVTLTVTNGAAVGDRLALLAARAAAGDCDLVVKGALAGEARGWVRTVTGAFQGDRATEAPIAADVLAAQAATPGQERTYTCAPPGSGFRLGVDRDGDGYLDRDEVDVGTDPADPTSAPRSP